MSYRDGDVPETDEEVYAIVDKPRRPLLKEMDTPALKAYVDDLQDALYVAVNVKQRGIGWMVREHEIGTAILRRREREAAQAVGVEFCEQGTTDTTCTGHGWPEA